jgi:hypothetical protein
MSWNEFVFQAEVWGYRIGGLLMLGFVDDPAWIAFMFC